MWAVGSRESHWEIAAPQQGDCPPLSLSGSGIARSLFIFLGTPQVPGYLFGKPLAFRHGVP